MTNEQTLIFLKILRQLMLEAISQSFPADDRQVSRVPLDTLLLKMDEYVDLLAKG